MTKQWKSDFYHGRKGQSFVHAQDRNCIECGKDATPRYLYCSPECALESQRKVWRARHKDLPYPARLA